MRGTPLVRSMFTLLSGFFDYLFRRTEFHVLILGLDKAGKTNVLERLKTMYTEVVGLDPGKILPTVGLNVGRIEAFGHNLVIWDLGGQTGLQSIWDKYYDESHAVVFVVDSANAQRFAESKAALDRALASIDLIGAPVILMANKQAREGGRGTRLRAPRPRPIPAVICMGAAMHACNMPAPA